MIRATAALALWALSAAAQQAPPSPPEEPKTTVRGRVVDARTGTAVKGARVTIEVDGRIPADSAFADHDGRFLLKEVPVGDHAIVSIKSGYEDYSRGIRILQSGVDELILRMDQYASITGRVVDVDGKPVVGAAVNVLQRLYREGSARQIPAGRGRDGQGRGTTDDRGRYRMWGLAFGSYVVAARPTPEPGPEGVMRLVKAGAFYPGVQSLKDAARLQLDWGQRLEGVDLVLENPPPTIVAGVVSSSDGRACENCWGTVTSMDVGAIDSIAQVRPNGEGALVIEGLTPGPYGLTVREFDRKTSSMRHGTALLEAAEGKTTEFVLEMHEEQPISGRIVMEKRPDPSEAQDSETGNPRPAMLLVSAYGDPSDLLSSARTPGGQTRVPSEGPGPYEFELSALPGLVRVRVTTTGRNAYLREVRLDGRRLEGDTLEVPVGGLENLECVLSFDVGTVTGKVTRGDQSEGRGPLLPEGRVVRLIPVGGGDVQQLGSRIEADSSFTVQGAPPGRYVAYALPGRPGYAPDDPLIQPRLNAYGKTIEVRAGQATEVTLTTAPRFDELP